MSQAVDGLDQSSPCPGHARCAELFGEFGAGNAVLWLHAFGAILQHAHAHVPVVSLCFYRRHIQDLDKIHAFRTDDRNASIVVSHGS